MKMFLFLFFFFLFSLIYSVCIVASISARWEEKTDFIKDKF